MSAGVNHQSLADIPIVLLIAPRSARRDHYDSVLRRGGVWTELASSPQEGLDAARELRPDAIVVEGAGRGSADLANLTRSLRRHQSTRHIPLVPLPSGQIARTPRAGGRADGEAQTADLVLHVRAVIARAALLRARVGRLRERSGHLRERSQQAIDRAASAIEKAHRFRNCPSCGAILTYAETRTLHGVMFDYFRPCPGGCGLFSYDRAGRRMVTIIG